MEVVRIMFFCEKRKTNMKRLRGFGSLYLIGTGGDGILE